MNSVGAVKSVRDRRSEDRRRVDGQTAEEEEKLRHVSSSRLHVVVYERSGAACRRGEFAQLVPSPSRRPGLHVVLLCLFSGESWRAGHVESECGAQTLT